MLKSFEISNFRLFQRLEVKKLNQVNLLVGKNNSGKSTFLEALQLYVSNAAPFVILNLVESRQETWFSEVQPQSQSLTGNSVRHLFFGHKLTSIGETGILLGETSSSEKLHISLAAYKNEKNEEGQVQQIRIPNSQLDLFESGFTDFQLVLLAEEGEKTKRLFPLERDLRDIRRYGSIRTLYEKQETEFKYTWQIVATDNMPNKKLEALWSLISVTPLGSEVVIALQLIDKRVSGITFIEDVSQRRSDNRIPMIKLEGMDELLPLRSMGDGITRLFHIIVALVSAKNGLLLIDEFENGLHWSVQPKVWEIIFELSKRLNVQIFATTHSRDCIAGFDYAWNKYSDLGTFFRLDNKNGVIKVTEYTLETLTDSLEMDIEVR